MWVELLSPDRLLSNFCFAPHSTKRGTYGVLVCHSLNNETSRNRTVSLLRKCRPGEVSVCSGVGDMVQFVSDVRVALRVSCSKVPFPTNSATPIYFPRCIVRISGEKASLFDGAFIFFVYPIWQSSFAFSCPKTFRISRVSLCGSDLQRLSVLNFAEIFRV